MGPVTADLRALRRQLRRLRTGLPQSQRLAAERQIHRYLRQLRVFRPGVRVAVYLSMRGEASLAASLGDAATSRAQLYAPRILNHRRHTMTFVPFDPRAATRRNGYGIAEPPAPLSRARRTVELDVVLVPLLGFDRRGVRLGMGAGYYDRALRRRIDPTRAFRRPRLIGIAYACQELPSIAPAPWDVPLDLVVTEREIVRCRPLPPPGFTDPS